jgi:hypothetical protein
MGSVEDIIKSGKPLQIHKHLSPMKKLHRNLEAYQELLIELLTTVRAMKVALAKRIERLEYHGY